ncbi:hypothetical protein D7B24_005611 [Verticillium nonalfalfae]|uniref:Uncharacterized protein n=1 Tax=Verticillium nonalfalfae TaxID=1051616 RepID=A0A3M9YE09_9PEZI|nr:uncharacterized protein D7B24_005611 [Verticillium nonalfalfae]RNJ57818.1 hypothetical protein D7B24_005611 [Verticillium nonalfalfae]
MSLEEWDLLSPEARIRSEGDRKWGWVVYRSCYAKEFDPRWQEIKSHIVDELCKDIARSDTPSIAKTMDFVFIEDPALEGAMVTQLQHYFQAWARASEGYHFDEGRDVSRDSRHEFFIMVDEQSLRNRTLGLVHGWPLEQDSEDVAEEGNQHGAGDWIRITADYTVTTSLYEQLNDLEYWYSIYKPPEMGLACV